MKNQNTIIAPSTLGQVYRRLEKSYGTQGWWPLYDRKARTCVYPGLEVPDDAQVFEIAIGAILAQNVAWSNVAKCIISLSTAGILTPAGIEGTDDSTLAALIRSSVYYNQKVRTIREFMHWYGEWSATGGRLANSKLHEIRKSLLDVRGIGAETADSILLYALGYRIFVVDAYTRRIFTRMGIFDGNESYQDIQDYFHRRFRGDVRDYREFHALIVNHGKDVCRPRPQCQSCSLHKRCRESQVLQ